MLFRLAAGDHDFPPAGLTANLKIHAGAQNQKTVAAAGMVFLHHQYIANPNVHCPSPFINKIVKSCLCITSVHLSARLNVQTEQIKFP